MYYRGETVNAPQREMLPALRRFELVLRETVAAAAGCGGGLEVPVAEVGVLRGVLRRISLHENFYRTKMYTTSCARASLPLKELSFGA